MLKISNLKFQISDCQKLSILIIGKNFMKFVKKSREINSEGLMLKSKILFIMREEKRRLVEMESCSTHD